MAEHPRPRRRVPTVPAGVGVVGVLALSVRIVPGHPVHDAGLVRAFFVARLGNAVGMGHQVQARRA